MAQRRLPAVPIRLPDWNAYCDELEQHLEVEPEEAADVQGYSTIVWLPGAVRDDLVRLSDASGWSLGQLIGYFTMQGIQRQFDSPRES